jgi:hypothetical protein
MTPTLYLTAVPTDSAVPAGSADSADSADAAGAPPTIFTPAAPLRIPLGAGLAAAVHGADESTDRELTTDDLVARDATAGMLWDAAADAMLATLGRLTAVHGPALRRRRVPDLDGEVWEIAVVDDPFPGTGLVAHPRLARHTHRVLTAAGIPRIAVDGSRLLALGPDAAPAVGTVGLDISTGHCLQAV